MATTLSVDTSSIPTTTNTTTGSSTNTTSSSSSSGSLTSGINMGKEDFLKLLTTQLQYQDPLSPADPKDFVAQLSQFSSLEQLINVNSKLDDFSKTIASLQGTQKISQGVSLLGKTVQAQGNVFQVTSGSPGSLSCALTGAAAKVTVSIYDSSGKLVRTMDLGSQSAGTCDISWDGKDSNGNKVADGTYSFSVGAVDSKGATVTTATLVSGKVEEVLQDSDNVYLKINGRLTTIDNIISIEPS
jgi:flagellar basal-body rod modification protein FlgD